MSPHKSKKGAPRTFASPLEGALFMAARGFKVFPLKPNTKDPFEIDVAPAKHRRLCGGYHRATTDEKKIRAWAKACPDLNFGVYAGDGVIVDVDMKSGRDGFAAYREKFGEEPTTFRVNTPSDGAHLYFDDKPCRQRPLIEGYVDIRSHHGYVVCPGSIYNGRSYTIARDVKRLSLPANVKEALAKKPEKHERSKEWLCEPDNEHDIARATEWLKSRKEVTEGGRSDDCFKAAAQLKDFGLSAETSTDLMIEHWKCVPLLDHNEIAAICQRAHRYGSSPPGCNSFEECLRDFEDIAADADLKAQWSKHDEERKQKQPFVWPVMMGIGDKARPDPNSLKNVEAFLKHLHVTVRLDEFSGEHTVKGMRGYSILNDSALRLLWTIMRAQGLGCSWDAFVRLVLTAGDRNRYHPVREYLAGLEWDGKPRLDWWLTTYAGAEKSELNSHFGRVFLLGAVKRVLEPGCKFDYALVLEDERQGTGKSSLVRILGGKWYSDCLKLGMDAKETIERTRGGWIQEIPELGGMQNREVEAIKAQITTQVDRARAAYGRTAEAIPRQFVLFGTTNDVTYLKDRTGNRRFLPVRAGKIDLKALKRDRDQLWAEAYQRAKAGEPAVLPETMWELARAAQDARVEIDPIKEQLTELLDGVTGRVLKEDLWIAQGRPLAANRTQKEKNQLTAAMRELGWAAEQQKHQKSKRRRQCYAKGSAQWRELTGDHEFI
jgi:hypothetical protein